MQKAIRTIAESDGTVQTQTVGECAINVGAKAGSAQSCSCGRAGKERRSASLLHGHIVAKNGSVLLAEDSENYSFAIDHCHCHARVTARAVVESQPE